MYVLVCGVICLEWRHNFSTSIWQYCCVFLIYTDNSFLKYSVFGNNQRKRKCHWGAFQDWALWWMSIAAHWISFVWIKQSYSSPSPVAQSAPRNVPHASAPLTPVHDDNKASKARISLDAMTKPYDTNTKNFNQSLLLKPAEKSQKSMRLSMTLATYYYVSSVSSVSSYVSSRAGRQSAYLLRKKCSNIRLNSSSTTDTDWNTIEKIAASLKDGKYKRVLIVAGAGVSCSAGIPDFRTPGTGIYDNLQKYNLPYPEAIFDVNFYRHNPMPFVTLSKEIWPGVKYRPTLTHCFFSLLGSRYLSFICQADVGFLTGRWQDDRHRRDGILLCADEGHHAGCLLNCLANSSLPGLGFYSPRPLYPREKVGSSISSK